MDKKSLKVLRDKNIKGGVTHGRRTEKKRQKKETRIRVSFKKILNRG